MSIRSTAVFNAPLTSYAQGIAADRLAAYRLANLICPIVQVGAASGTYKVFNDKNSFLIEDDSRALGGPRKRLQFEAGDATYNCKPRGLEIGLDDFESDLAGAAGEQRTNILEQGKIKSMVSRKALGYANRVFGAVTANVTPVTGKGQWSNPNIDPIDQLDEQLDALSTDIGTTENISLIIGVSGWRALRGNAKVKARLGIKGEMVLSREMLLNALVFPVGLEVSATSIVTKKFGQADVATGEKTQILAGYALLNYSVPSPTPFDASSFKCFSTSSVLVDSVKSYRDETSNATINALDWSEDIKQTSALASRLISLT